MNDIDKFLETCTPKDYFKQHIEFLIQTGCFKEYVYVKIDFHALKFKHSCQYCDSHEDNKYYQISINTSRMYGSICWINDLCIMWPKIDTFCEEVIKQFPCILYNNKPINRADID